MKRIISLIVAWLIYFIIARWMCTYEIGILACIGMIAGAAIGGFIQAKGGEKRCP